MIVSAPIARMLTSEQSSAIAFIKIEDKTVTIAYQSNAERMYEFTSDSETFINQLTQICLLYTSPSPRDLSTSRMPSSA